MKMSKNIILLSIMIVTLICLVAVATYSYFTASVNTNNNIITSTKLPLRPTFAVSGGGELALTITRNLILKENAYKNDNNWVSGKNFYYVEKNITVTLTGEPGTTCSYNIYYKDTSSNGNYVYSKTGINDDFDITLSKNSTLIIDYFDYKNLSQTSAGVPKITAMFGGSAAPFNKAKPTITIPSGSTTATDNWKLHFQFVNLNYDQSTLADKTFKGEVYIGDVSCT